MHLRFRFVCPLLWVWPLTAIAAVSFWAAEMPGLASEPGLIRDGTPAFLRLDDPSDQDAFRRWFTFLAEIQYFTPAGERPVEISDCAALVRYAYREALRLHDERWTATVRLPFVPALGSVKKFNYPFTPLGASLFRLRPGPFSTTQLHDGTFGQFANVETLQRFNTFRIGRDLAAAEPGDLLIFRRVNGHMPYHSMIFVGESQIAADGKRYIVYHTGPEGDSAGEVRRHTAQELLHYPDPQWRPIVANACFLGIFRWNILRPNA